MTTEGGDKTSQAGDRATRAESETAEAERWRRVRALFEDAVDRDESEWPLLLATAGDDERELLARLLAADGTSESPLDWSPDQLAADLFPSSEPIPDRIGKFRVLRLLGRGGMGQVLLARRDDGAYDQEVAIKLVRRGMDSEDVLRRFRAERQILAGLTHANIARLLDGGVSDDGRPYFVLEFVPGTPITAFCEAHALSTESRLRLFETVCSAVQHAHERGVVHRDLKPRNVIVAEADEPGSGTVKLLDFGIAKLLAGGGGSEVEEAGTRTGVRLMTPEYASPEQFRGGDVGPSSDVYSLGIILYELITNRKPYELKGRPLGDVERIVCDEPPARPANGSRRVPAALEAIVLTALRKEPERRYASAGGLGDDVRRFLVGEAVRARSDSVSYRVRTFVRRRTAGLALLVAAAGLVVGIGGVLLSRSGSPPPMAVADTADPLAIAVLPFDYNGPEGQEYFADGVADVVHAHLASLPGLTVVAHSRAVQYRDTGRTAQEIGAELGVGYILAGSVRFERPTDPSGRVVVEPHLIRVANDSVVWSRTFDHTMVQFFALQSVVAREVARSLRLEVTGVEWSARSAAVTADLEAYRFYLRGNDFLRFNEDESRLRLAEASYLQALARDSTFAAAWAKLSAVHTQMWFYRFDPSDERLAGARDAAERAMRHHPGLPESYYALGMFLYQGRGDLRQAQRYFERALELQPNHVRGLIGLASVLRRQGRMEEALAHFEQLAVLDPLDANHIFSVAFTQQLLRHYTESEERYATAVQHAADLPLLYAAWARMRLSRTGSIAEARSVLGQGTGAAMDNDFTRFVAVELDLMQGRYGEVLSRTAAWKTDVLDTQPWYMPVAWLRSAAYRGLGDFERARVQEQVALRILEARVLSHPSDARAHGALGRVYAALGQPAEAVEAAKRGVELQPHSRDAVLAPFRVEDLAAVYLLTGQVEEALTQLEALLAMSGMISPRHLHADPFWGPLKTNPRFPPVS